MLSTRRDVLVKMGKYTYEEPLLTVNAFALITDFLRSDCVQATVTIQRRCKVIVGIHEPPDIRSTRGDKKAPIMDAYTIVDKRTIINFASINPNIPDYTITSESLNVSKSALSPILGILRARMLPHERPYIIPCS